MSPSPFVTWRRRAARLAAVVACALSAAGPAVAATPDDSEHWQLRAPATAPTPQPTRWACFPGRTPNPCEDGDQRTTVLASTLTRSRRVARVEPAPAPGARPIDCFYLYGTVSGGSGLNAPRHVTREVQGILQAQPARFSGTCRVFAPVYRQATSPAIGSSALTGQRRTSRAIDTAFADVLGAWRDYLAHENGGRGVLLIGHSQGSGMLMRMMERDIDDDPAVRDRLVGALLIGGGVNVRRGERVGGSFAHIPTCAQPGEFGCVVGFSAFGQRPGATALFGRLGPLTNAFGGPPRDGRYAIACTNPAQLAGDGETLRPVLHSAPRAGGDGALEGAFWSGLRPRASTGWVVPGDRYRARCVDYPGQTTVLNIRATSAGSLQPVALPWGDWGLHIGEVSLVLGSLVRIAELQTASWLAAHPGGVVAGA